MSAADSTTGRFGAPFLCLRATLARMATDLDLLGERDPTDEELATFARLLADGVTPSRAAEMMGLPRVLVVGWLEGNGNFTARLSRARNIGLASRADSLLDDLDVEEPNVPLLRLKSDNTRFYLTVHRPEKYSPRVDVNVTQTLDLQGAINDANARLAAGLQQGRMLEAERVDESGACAPTPPDNQSTEREPETLDDLI